VVDENDCVIGHETKSVVHSKNLRRRIVHVLLFDDTNRLALQLRGPKCDFLPGHWCTSVGGHVISGESYKAAALRESFEEIGVKPELTFLGKRLFTNTSSGVELFVSVFSAKYSGKFRLEKGKVDLVKYFSLQEIKNMLDAQEKFHPELVFILNNFVFDK